MPDTLFSASDAWGVTPSDSTPLVNTSRALYIGGTGNVKVDTVDGEQGVVFVAVPVGTLLPIRATKVYATGTTATNIVELF